MLSRLYRAGEADSPLLDLNSLDAQTSGPGSQSSPALSPPFPLAHEGIFHPDFDGPVDARTYFAEKWVPGRLTVGLWFYQTYWVNNNLSFVKGLIRACEKMGANVIPVFHLRYKDKALGNRGADWVADHFFKQDG